MFAEYIAIDNATKKVELRELTETMAENLSEVATVMSVECIGGKATVWSNREPHIISVDSGTLMELKRRVIWSDKHLGLMS